jgi:hypothetical protein
MQNEEVILEAAQEEHLYSDHMLHTQVRVQSFEASRRDMWMRMHPHCSAMYNVVRRVGQPDL